MLLITAGTSYALHYPDYRNEGFEQEARERIAKASQLSFKDLKKRHLKDFCALSERCTLKLGGKIKDTVPTDLRLEQYKKNPSDPWLESLYFQYGRYLLISSSRAGSLPANLQGVWSNKIQTPWNGDYHTNINIRRPIRRGWPNATNH